MSSYREQPADQVHAVPACLGSRVGGWGSQQPKGFQVLSGASPSFAPAAGNCRVCAEAAEPPLAAAAADDDADALPSPASSRPG